MAELRLNSGLLEMYGADRPGPMPAISPGRGRVPLRPARPVFLEVRAWTGDIVDASYDPPTRLLAAIYGEPQRGAEWARRAG
jgi:hypothetical protein